MRVCGNEKRDQPIKLVAYSDADFVVDTEERKSVTGDLLTLDDMPTSWVCKKQGAVSLSTIEAEQTSDLRWLMSFWVFVRCSWS